NLYLQLYGMMMKVGYVRSDEDLRKVKTYFETHLPAYELDKLGFREKLWLYKAHLWYSLLTQDFLSAYRYASKWVDLFYENEHMIPLNPVFFLKGNHYLLEALFFVKYASQFRETLDRLEHQVESPEFPQN